MCFLTRSANRWGGEGDAVLDSIVCAPAHKSLLLIFFVIKNNKKRVGGQTPTPLQRKMPSAVVAPVGMKCGICLLAAAQEVECGAVISGVGRETLLVGAELSLCCRPCDGMSCPCVLSHQYWLFFLFLYCPKFFGIS